MLVYGSEKAVKSKMFNYLYIVMISFIQILTVTVGCDAYITHVNIGFFNIVFKQIYDLTIKKDSVHFIKSDLN